MSGIDLALQCRVAGLPEPVAEYRFAPPRRWRFDFAWPGQAIALEVDGGGFINGRHSRGLGIEKDCEKFNEAVLIGYTVLRVTPRLVANGTAINLLVRAFSRLGSGLVTSPASPIKPSGVGT